MRVKKFQAKSMPEAMSMVKTELGEDAIILHSREKHPGIMGLFLGRGVEVTAAVDVKAVSKNKHNAKSKRAQQQELFDDVLPPILQPQSSTAKPAVGRKFDFKVDDSANLKEAPNPLLELSKKLQDETDKTLADQQQDEEKRIPNPGGTYPKPPIMDNAPKIEQRLIHLESQLSKLTGMLEHFSPAMAGGGVPSVPPKTREIYNHLLDQDVDESLALSIATKIAETTDEKDDTWTALKSHLLDKIPVSPRIELDENPKSPKIIMLVGPTGVGKTTTLAKISAQYRYSLDNKFKPKIVFITADLYRLAAVEQLQKYTEILGVNLEVTYSPDEVKQALKKHKDAHLILFDTAGTAQRNMPQINTLCGIVDAAQPSEVHLVLSATTKFSDAIDIIEHFKDMQPSRLIFSKVDESTTFGMILNICMKYKIPISYVTTGQNVPEDIECARPERIAKLLLTKPAVNRSMTVDTYNSTIPNHKEKSNPSSKIEVLAGTTVESKTPEMDKPNENGNEKKYIEIPLSELKAPDAAKKEKRA